MTEMPVAEGTPAEVVQATQTLLDTLFPYGFEFHLPGIVDQFGYPDTWPCPMAMVLNAVEHDGMLLPVVLWGSGDKVWKATVQVRVVEPGSPEGKPWGAATAGRTVLKLTVVPGSNEMAPEGPVFFLNASKRYREPTEEQKAQAEYQQAQVRAVYGSEVQV